MFTKKGSRMKSTQVIRRLLVMVCLVAPLSVPGVGSAASISGTTCTNEGQTRQVANAKYVCQKTKKGKLRWRPQTATPTGDPNRIVDNGYINIDGVRVSTFPGKDKYGYPLVERCGDNNEITVRLWFTYADGSSRVERWLINRQVHVFYNDKYNNPAAKKVYVDASWIDPEFDGEGEWPASPWIWCANKPMDIPIPIK